jgi:hypothetical protein
MSAPLLNSNAPKDPCLDISKILLNPMVNHHISIYVPSFHGNSFPFSDTPNEIRNANSLTSIVLGGKTSMALVAILSWTLEIQRGCQVQRSVLP